MSISSNRYVDVTSIIGGAAAFPTRELKLRLYSTNELLPTGSVLNFSLSAGGAKTVADYFGTDTEEYKQALYYAGFVSKQGNSSNNIQFARWADIPTTTQIFGSRLPLLSELQSISAGNLELILDGDTATISVDFSAATSYADVATELETKIQAAGAASLASATVTYDATRQAFTFDSVTLELGAVTVTSTDGTDIKTGWSADAIFSDGVAAESITDVLLNATDIDNNYGSFAFIPSFNLTQAEEAAAWSDSSKFDFQYLLPVVRTDATTYSDALKAYVGVGMTLYDAEINANQYPHLHPAAILASQRFSNPNAAESYNYQRDTRISNNVFNDSDADFFDSKIINFHGQTQESGVKIGFYQKGRLTGGPQDAFVEMGVYAGEQWLRARIRSEFLNMFATLPIVPADQAGVGLGYGYIRGIVDEALLNGTISQGKELTSSQIAYITSISNDSNAYLEVANRGWWLNVTIEQETDQSGGTVFVLNTLLIYAKRDSISKVEHRNILI